jgi:hypothetical protein
LSRAATRMAALAQGEYSACKRLIFGPAPEDEDVLRWYSQGIGLVSRVEGVESFRAGLKQTNGGPCGVLAAIQGFILRKLLFPDVSYAHIRGVPSGGAKAAAAEGSPFPAVSEAGLRELVSFGVSLALWQTAQAPTADSIDGGGDPEATALAPASSVVRIALPAEGYAGGDISPGDSHEAFRIESASTFSELQSLVEGQLETLARPHGVMLVVLSAILTRGPETIRAEMDEPDQPLTARFGHCEQGMVSLFVTGAATTNVFDGVMGGETAPIPGMTMRGVSRTPPIGYLSQLEAMRYTTVGEFLKTPEVPVWVVGSQSHFTVLFSTDATCNLPDPATRVRRKFDVHDASNAGMIPLESVPVVLAAANLPLAGQPVQTKAFSSRLDKGIGMALWTDFWEAVRGMVVPRQPGEAGFALVDESKVEAQCKAVFDALDTMGGGFVQVSQVKDLLVRLDWPLARADPAGESFQAMAKAVGATAVDEIVFFEGVWEAVKADLVEAARSAKQEELEAVALSERLTLPPVASETSSSSAAASAPATDVSLPPPPKRQRSDSEIARELEQSWSQEPQAAPTEDEELARAIAASLQTESEPKRPKHEPAPTLAPTDSLQEDIRNLYGEQKLLRSFELFHYNGLSDSTRASTCQSVGVKQNESGLVTDLATADVANGGDARAFESVLRTKWHGAMVTYRGVVAPKID